MYQVEVSDYYAHAWVEVYLEGQGFVPFEVTPPSFEAAPEATQVSGIGGFFSRLLNVDLGFGSDASENTSSVIGEDVTPVIEEKSDMDLSIFVIPLFTVVGIVICFWLMFLIVRKAVSEMKYAKYMKNGQFAPLVFARYNELLAKLMRKKIVKRDNTLPLELCEILSELNLGSDIDEASGKNDQKDKYEEYLEMFTYAEKVMYSNYKTNIEEYDGFYRKLREIKNST